MKPKYLIGVDEVGRGPLAGPVAVGAFLVKGKVPNMFKNIRDSKQLSALGRAMWLERIRNLKKESKQSLDFKVSFVSSKLIDEKGISWALRTALKRSLKKLNVDPKKSLVLLDGGLRAPKEYVHQKTIIKGDEKEPIIALASIVAKVLRDKKMERFSVMYPKYGFHIHKGYGTKQHILSLKKHGLSEIHRKTFTTRL